MKRLKGKKGFTLVECVVAMALLAIMSLLLTMLLNVAVRQKNSNVALDKEIDEQIGNIAADGGDTEIKTINKDIKLYANNAEIEDKIPGNNNDAEAELIKHKGENVNLNTYKYDFDNYSKFKDIADGKYAEDDSPSEGYEKSNCFGALDIKDGNVTITQISVGYKRKGESTIDASVQDGVEYEYCVLKWRMGFVPNEFSTEKSVKVRIPKIGKINSCSIVAGSVGDANAVALSDSLVRMEPGAKEKMETDVEFKVMPEDFDKIESVEKFYKGVGSGSSTVVKIEY